MTDDEYAFLLTALLAVLIVACLAWLLGQIYWDDCREERDEFEE